MVCYISKKIITAFKTPKNKVLAPSQAHMQVPWRRVKLPRWWDKSSARCWQQIYRPDADPATQLSRPHLPFKKHGSGCSCSAVRFLLFQKEHPICGDAIVCKAAWHLFLPNASRELRHQVIAARQNFIAVALHVQVVKNCTCLIGFPEPPADAPTARQPHHHRDAALLARGRLCGQDGFFLRQLCVQPEGKRGHWDERHRYLFAKVQGVCQRCWR